MSFSIGFNENFTYIQSFIQEFKGIGQVHLGSSCEVPNEEGEGGV